MNLIKLTHIHWSLLGLALLGMALSLASQPARRFERPPAKALSAALFSTPQPAPGQTAIAEASFNDTFTVNNTFTVRSYCGKCLEFGAPLTRIEEAMAKSYPVFISDCNGGARQQVRVEELTDRPGRLVILRAGNGVIGKKVTTGLTQQAASAALVFTSTANQIPLEAQPYTGSEGQIFALDGDSIILAADRNLVVEVQNHRGANKTPLVLGRRDLADSEFWTFTATDGSARRPTSGFKRVPADSDGFEFKQTVESATPGTVIEVDADASIDLTNPAQINIPEGVTIRGDRRGTRLGPELWVQQGVNKRVLEIFGNDVRITGLRMRGPSRSTDEDHPLASGILFNNSAFHRSIIDHNDMSDWTSAAVEIRGESNSKVCHAGEDNSESLPENIRVMRNFIHHNRQQGEGYGVSVQHGANARIEGNTFVSNRHAIKGGGEEGTIYRAWYNLVLSDAPEQKYIGGLVGYYTHDFDVHGTDESTFGGLGGQYFEIARNTFLGRNRPNFKLRGDTCNRVEYQHNVSLQKSPAEEVDTISGFTSLLGHCPECAIGCAASCRGSDIKVYNTNQFKASDPTLRLGVGDFDGDDRDDLFLATGAAWYYAPAGKAEWRFLNAQTDRVSTLLFGDFDGDGRTDVFTQHGSNWEVSWGGASHWEKINASRAILGNAAIGDFDGDHRADVFYADGHQWLISFGGTGQFTHFKYDTRRVSNLRFGDFNGDGKTDVFGIVGESWMVVHGGTDDWTPLRPKSADPMIRLMVADFDGDGRADVATSSCCNSGSVAQRFKWLVSRGGTGDLTTLGAGPRALASASGLGRFDDSPGADVLMWHAFIDTSNGNYFDITSGGAGASVRHSRQDMR